MHSKIKMTISFKTCCLFAAINPSCDDITGIDKANLVFVVFWCFNSVKTGVVSVAQLCQIKSSLV